MLFDFEFDVNTTKIRRKIVIELFRSTIIFLSIRFQ